MIETLDESAKAFEEKRNFIGRDFKILNCLFHVSLHEEEFAKNMLSSERISSLYSEDASIEAQVKSINRTNRIKLLSNILARKAENTYPELVSL